ncbi:hypothetical protein [Streptomyces sp. AM 2-1-1]|uniref:hypothetical protein n=1 Tax=Streptomyces sp. AM 2-1-1 TaxID=3028709 RepID=UPI0023B8A3BD|nr:hypothetical protein [Streptomyces sp. AM 2-1-1]WEH43941.1 hypothetical protein PZB77_15365 [Streptomyces sp. AM 2-1-1]
MTDPTPTGRCGNDPRTVLSPADQAAIAKFTEYLARRRRSFAAVAEEEPENDEQRADREETERAHEAGNHEHCGPTCEVEFPSGKLRNTILYAALPGSARMLDELLRRAAVAPEAEVLARVRALRESAPAEAQGPTWAALNQALGISTS